MNSSINNSLKTSNDPSFLTTSTLTTASKTVVLIISKLRIGGAEQFVITLAKSLKKLGHNPHIVLLYDVINLPVPSDIPVHIFNYSKLRKYPNALRKYMVPRTLDKFILNNIGTPDLVLSNLLSADKYMAHSQLTNTYLIVHNTLSKRHKLTPKNLKILKETYLQKPCIGVSKGVAEDLINLLGSGIDIKTIYDPVDVTKVQDLNEEFIPPIKNYLVSVGNFKEAKRQDILLRAYKESGLDIPLVLIGDGERLQPTKDLSKQLGINDKVHFIGKTTNPYPYIKHAIAKIISSDYEGLNIAMLEAIALSTPVISTSCPSGPAEVLPDRNLSPIGDVEALAQLMQKVVVDPESYIIPLAEQFYPDNAAEQYLSLIKS